MKSNRLQAYQNLVEKKFNLYNSMFLGLPFKNIKSTGTLIPILKLECEKGFEANKSPEDIINHFFDKHTDFETEQEKIDFMFHVIQYVERQVVLFDAVEDASFKKISAMGNNLNVIDITKREFRNGNTEELLEVLNKFSVRLVFTAHPTQFYPHPVLDIINDLREDIEYDTIDDIDTNLQQLGLTSFIQKEKPTPLQEASNIIYYLRNVYYNAISDYYFELQSHLANFDFDNPNILRIGFWPGGDRDGNPYVTAEITREVGKALRTTLMKCYYNDVKSLEKKLTFEKTHPLIQNLRATIYDSIFNRNESVPYQEILAVLLEVKKWVKEEYNSLYINELLKLINKVNIFKNHFATMDIRQNHQVHEDIITDILKYNGYIKNSIDELSESELQTILFTQELNTQGLVFEEDANGVKKETFENFKNIEVLQRLGGEQACNRYVISNSENENAVLFVLALFRINGYPMNEINVDIVPLFETMTGMQNSESIMKNLFRNNYYSAHLQHRNKQQTIMLGFSDGTKDGGYLKANWSIFKTKETLSQLCEKEEVEVLFFDGRGGPPARGGGKTHRFYASQSNLIANNDIELTIQGQTITSTYGTEDSFLYNCDQMLTAGIQNHLIPQEDKIIDNKNRALLEELSELSFKAYESLKHHPQFIPYLERMSTLQYYGKANIGSRPGKRGNKAQLTLEDLRAISFVGAWSQLKQNVPGYFGIGSAIENLKNEGRIEEVKRLWQEVPFFRALMKNSMMSLEKSFFPLTKYMSDNKEFKDFWMILYQEYQLSYESLLEISGYHELMEEEPISRASIQQREDIVLPLLAIQQFALLQIQNDTDLKEVYQTLVVRSLYGNINASRNSA